MGAGGRGPLCSRQSLGQQHSQIPRGAEVHMGCADGEAGDPASAASTVFSPGGAMQVLACINDAEFNDVDLLAAPAAVSRR